MPQVADARAPVRVLFVEQATAFGGAFVVIAELIRRLRLDCVQPFLVTAMDRGFVSARLGGGATPVRRMHHLVDYVRVARLSQRLTRLGVPRRAAGYFVTAIAAVANIGYSLRLAMMVLRQRVDVIHINNGTEHAESNLALVALARRCVVHVHGAKPSTVQRMFLNRVARIVAISDMVRERLEQGGVDPGRIVVAPNPVALPAGSGGDAAAARVRVRRQYSVPDDALVVGIFGRIVRWKGHREFLLAVAEVTRSMPNVYAMIVGDSADLDLGHRAELARITRELGIEHRVVFTGFVADVTSYYYAVDVVAHCSIEPEPFGLVIIESMACGVPVIAANLGAPTEIITDGIDGLLVDPKQTDLLAAAMRSLLQDANRRKSLADRALEMVKRRYDPDRYARFLEAIYLEVAKARDRVPLSSLT